MSAPWVAAILVFIATATPVPAAQTTEVPTLAYWTDTEVVIADAEGATIGTFPNHDHISLNNNVVAGEVAGARPEDMRIVVSDATSGDRHYRIPDARLPVVTAGGDKVAFFPAYERDKFGATVWIRTPGGTLRKVARFKTSPTSPGIPHGMRAGAVPLDIALDDRGRTMAVVAGLETVRSFDVWVVNVRTREWVRATRGENSHNPSLSPDGSHLAVRVESPDSCPDPIYGEILVGKLRVIDLASDERGDLTAWDCEVFYDTPRWIDDDSLVAVRVTKDTTEEFGYDLDIVRFDLDTGAMTEVVTEGNPCCLSVSASLGKIAFEYSDRTGFGLLDAGSGVTIDFPSGHVPHVSGENRF